MSDRKKAKLTQIIITANNLNMNTIVVKTLTILNDCL